jgi:hypothetical protein
MVSDEEKQAFLVPGLDTLVQGFVEKTLKQRKRVPFPVLTGMVLLLIKILYNHAC